MLEVSALVRSLLFPGVPVLCVEQEVPGVPGVPGVTADHLVEAGLDVVPHSAVVSHRLLGRTLLAHRPRTPGRPGLEADRHPAV